MKTFYIQAMMTISVTIRHSANSLEDAMKDAKGFEDKQFIKAVGEWQDTPEFEITGVYRADA